VVAGHGQAGFRAAAAGLGAGLAVVCLVLAALVGAGRADFRAQAAQLHGGVAGARHIGGRLPAQSMSSAMQRAIILTSSSFRQAVEQLSQAAAQALQASIQAWYWACWNTGIASSIAVCEIPA